MYISEISLISNYRNLSGLSIKFNKSVNFIIGENNIGKTNILELFNIIFCIGRFSESDFENIFNPIKIKLKISYENDEIGFFEDFFDVNDKNTITIIAEQEDVDSHIVYYHDTPNCPKINNSIIRKLNVLYYYAQRMPIKELDFRKSSGSGKVLNYLVQKSLEDLGLCNADILDHSQINIIISQLNTMISELSNITNDRISAYLDPNTENVISRLLLLGDESNHNIGSLGVGIQYSFNILLQILDIVYNVKITRKDEDFQERLIIIDGKKYFPIFLLLDEPEIHQHPYRQRNIIKKIIQLINNNNSQFNMLLHNLFQIDGLIGQIFIVTHSPNILLSDYQQFIRIYKDHEENTLKCVSGVNLNIESNYLKHIFHNYMPLKEAMFSKYVIFVEGDTEMGGIPEFAKRKNFDLDEHSVGVIKLDGAKGIEKFAKIYSYFQIPYIAVLDRDQESQYKSVPHVYFTKEIDYEAEICANFKLTDYFKCCVELEDDLLTPMIKYLKEKIPDFNPKSFLNDPTSLKLDEDLEQVLWDDIKEKQIGFLRKSKNTLTGAILAKNVTIIPNVFNNIIELIEKALT